MIVSLIVPTLREAKNLEILIPKAGGTLKKALKNNYEIIIVDDNSRDGTDKVVKKLGKKYRTRLFVRKKEKGLSGAVISGFRKAKGDHFIVMDADLSHPPELLSKVVAGMKKGYPVVLPSRYMRGGGAEKWPLDRKIISLVATSFSKFLTRAADPMSGFFGIHRDVIKDVDLNPIGYKILLEILVKGRYDRKKVLQIPYIFKNRNIGTSKLSGRIYIEYLKQLRLLYRYKLDRLISGKGRDGP